jgi:hypothetical protein
MDIDEEVKAIKRDIANKCLVGHSYKAIFEALCETMAVFLNEVPSVYAEEILAGLPDHLRELMNKP